MNCKWCNKELNGANDYQLVGFCDLHCRIKGGDSDKIDLAAEIGASPNVVIIMENPPVVIPEVIVQAPVVEDVIPTAEEFFSKSVLKVQ